MAYDLLRAPYKLYSTELGLARAQHQTFMRVKWASHWELLTSQVPSEISLNISSCSEQMRVAVGSLIASRRQQMNEGFGTWEEPLIVKDERLD